MSSQYHDRILALAGIFQAAHLVQQLARHGTSNRTALVTSINSVLALDSKTAQDIYGGARGLTLGLQLLRDRLIGRADRSDMEMARYVVNIMQLERKLARDISMLAAIRERLQSLAEQMPAFTTDTGTDDEVSPTLAAKLAELYGMTLSTLTLRIMVSGEQGYLANPTISDKVRAALFAGTRSAYLWRQLGGQRWQLLLGRNAIAREAVRILDQVNSDDTAEADADHGEPRGE